MYMCMRMYMYMKAKWEKQESKVMGAFNFLWHLYVHFHVEQFVCT